MSWYKELSRQEKKTIAHIDDEILNKAVIIDFEGPKIGAPELVGYLKNGHFKTIFLNETFKTCMPRYSADCMSLEDFTQQILHDINVESRFIIGYTPREADVLLGYLQGSPAHWYKDAHKYFKKNVFHRKANKPEDWSLDGILKFYNIHKTFYGDRKISSYIQYAKKDLQKKEDFSSITKASKTKLSKAVNYNKEDVNCLFRAIEISLK